MIIDIGRLDDWMTGDRKIWRQRDFATEETVYFTATLGTLVTPNFRHFIY